MKPSISSFLQSRFNIYACRKLGWRFAYAYIKLLAWLYYCINRKEKTTIRAAVNDVFKERKKRFERNKLIKEVMRGVIAHYYEKLFNAYATGDTLRAFIGSHVSFDGLETIQTKLAHNKGLLLITGHVGGVELIPAFLGYHQFPVTIIAKFSSRQLREASEIQARRFNTRIIDADRTPNILRALRDNLRENRVVITQCDEIDEWRPSRQGQIRFLGKLTHMDKTIDVLSRCIKAPIVFGLMHRRQNHHYRFIVASRSMMEDYLRPMAPMAIGRIVLKYLEQYIYNHPAGWYQWKKYSRIVPVTSAADGLIHSPDVALMDTSVRKMALR